MRAFVPGRGSVEVLGSNVNGDHGEHRWNHLTFTLPLYLRWQWVFFLPFILEANCIATLLGCRGFLVTLVMMIPWSGLTQNLCLWPPYIYLLRTMRSHTLQSWSAKHSLGQWWLWGLRHHNVPLCPSTWASGCWGRPRYNFPTLTPLCVWFWGVVIQGHGVSSHDLQTILLFPLFFDLYVPIQHFCFLRPCMNLCQTLFIPFQHFRVL